MLSLLVTNSKAKGTRFRVSSKAGQVVLGRQGKVAVKDSSVSREHAAVWCDQGTWLVKDLSSSNGTFVNDERVERMVAIEKGDRLRLGKTELLVTHAGISIEHAKKLRAHYASLTTASEEGTTALLEQSGAGAALDDSDDLLDDLFEESADDVADESAESSAMSGAGVAAALQALEALSEDGTDADEDELDDALDAVAELEAPAVDLAETETEEAETEAETQPEPVETLAEAAMPEAVVEEDLAEVEVEPEAEIDLSASEQVSEASADALIVDEPTTEADTADDDAFAAMMLEEATGLIEVEPDEAEAPTAEETDAEPEILLDDEDAVQAEQPVASEVEPEIELSDEGVIEAAIDSEVELADDDALGEGPNDSMSDVRGVDEASLTMFEDTLVEKEPTQDADLTLQPWADDPTDRNEDAAAAVVRPDEPVKLEAELEEDVDDEAAQAEDTMSGATLAGVQYEDVPRTATRRAPEPKTAPAKAPSRNRKPVLLAAAMLLIGGGVGAALVVTQPWKALTSRQVADANASDAQQAGVANDAVWTLPSTPLNNGVPDEARPANNSIQLPNDFMSTEAGTTTPAPNDREAPALPDPAEPETPIVSAINHYQGHTLFGPGPNLTGQHTAHHEVNRNPLTPETHQASLNASNNPPNVGQPDPDQTTQDVTQADTPVTTPDPVAVVPVPDTPAASDLPATQVAETPDEPQAPILPGRTRQVYLVDASGSMIDSQRNVLNWLRRHIAGLPDGTVFTILFFRQGQVIEAPPAGMKTSTPRSREQMFVWLDPTARPINPSGRSDPAEALQLLTQYEPTEVWLLSDNAFGRLPGRRSGEDPQTLMLDVAAALAPFEAPLHTVQFYYQDPRNLLQRLADEHNGDFRFIEPTTIEEFEDFSVINLGNDQ